MNKAINLGSNLFSEAWVTHLHQGQHDNQILHDALRDHRLPTRAISKMMESKYIQGAERDVCFVHMGGYDTHDNMNDNFYALTTNVDHAMSELTTNKVEVAGRMGIYNNCHGEQDCAYFGRK